MGAIKVEEGRVVDTFQSFINPGTRLPHWITKLTGISENDIANAPFFDDIAPKLHEFLKNAVFIAHNVRFDYSFVKRQFEDSGFTYRPKLLCTVRLSRALYPQERGHSLEKIIKRHSISVGARHRAMDDAKAIYDFATQAYKEHGKEVFDLAVARQLKTKTLPPNVSEDLFKTLPHTAGVYIFRDENGLPLYIGKSIDIKTRVQSHLVNDTKVSRELKLSQRTWSIDHIVTDNELDALLLESRMIKEHAPLFNRKLRRKRSQSVIVGGLDDEGYLMMRVEARPLSDPVELENVYGVYKSTVSAKKALEIQLKEWQLCPKLLGLEKSKAACFYYQIGKCKGACIGKEPSHVYNARVEAATKATRLHSWPFDTPVLINVANKGYVIDNWVITHTVEHNEDIEPVFTSVNLDFDMDRYAILRQYIRKHKIQPVSVM